MSGDHARCRRSSSLPASDLRRSLFICCKFLSLFSPAMNPRPCELILPLPPLFLWISKILGFSFLRASLENATGSYEAPALARVQRRQARHNGSPAPFPRRTNRGPRQACIVSSAKTSFTFCAGTSFTVLVLGGGLKEDEYDTSSLNRSLVLA